MTVEDPTPPAEDIRADAQQPDVAEALRIRESFTREQVAWLMATAMRWGYELRVDEENAAYPPLPVFQLGRWYDQAEQRLKVDAEARLPRLNDHSGGPVDVWGDDGLKAAA